MDAVKFLKEVNRMCNKIENCCDCPLHDGDFCIHDIDNGKEEKAVSIVEQWSKENPVMTNLDKFKEVFGSANGIVAPSNWWHREYKAPKGEE